MSVSFCVSHADEAVNGPQFRHRSKITSLRSISRPRLSNDELECADASEWEFGGGEECWFVHYYLRFFSYILQSSQVIIVNHNEDKSYILLNIFVNWNKTNISDKTETKLKYNKIKNNSKWYF